LYEEKKCIPSKYPLKMRTTPKCKCKNTSIRRRRKKKTEKEKIEKVFEACEK
jgi:hypothetical protein